MLKPLIKTWRIESTEDYQSAVIIGSVDNSACAYYWKVAELTWRNRLDFFRICYLKNGKPTPIEIRNSLLASYINRIKIRSE